MRSLGTSPTPCVVVKKKRLTLLKHQPGMKARPSESLLIVMTAAILADFDHLCVENANEIVAAKINFTLTSPTIMLSST